MTEHLMRPPLKIGSIEDDSIDFSKIKELEKNIEILSNRFHTNILHDKTSYDTLDYRIKDLEKRYNHIYEGMEKLGKMVITMDDAYKVFFDLLNKGCERQAEIVQSHSEDLEALK